MALMQSEPSPIQIALTPRFKKDLRELAKRYRSIRADLQSLTEQLQAGETPGDQIAGIQYKIFKVRLKNSNIQKGKSGGYRVIYYLKTDTKIILITIYSKSDFSDVSNETIEAAIAQYEQEIQIANNSEPEVERPNP
jgi:mRNA-degrading endonuclease RelE of RelBE toxin-antitoxin system